MSSLNAILEMSASDLPETARALRRDVRTFLQSELEANRFTPNCDSWMTGFDPGFTRRLAEQGWVGMALPPEYGGAGRSVLDRFVLVEELLVAGAPVAAHWIADRQMGPGILRHGSELQKRRYLPAIAKGECYFAIGMSEPDAGSDLAAVRTRAREVADGWEINGTKLWSTGAHFAHAMVILARTDTADGNKHAGLSQFIVDLPCPGVTIRPIVTIDGAHHFNEVIFEEALIPKENLLGVRGAGWQQVIAELANERAGPERLLSTFPLLALWAERLRTRVQDADIVSHRELGQLIARAWTLRRMSLAVVSGLARGAPSEIAAALVKDVASRFEGQIVETVRRLARLQPRRGSEDPFERMLADGILHSPVFTLRGGTNEILRSLVARGLLGR